MENIWEASVKRFLVFMILLLPLPARTQRAVEFGEFFIDRTMRIDYYHVGDYNEDFITLDKIYQQGIWAGTTNNLIDPLNNGRYRVMVYDVLTNTLVFSRGYDTYFGEYRTTDPARHGVKRTFHETVLIPYPKRPVYLVIEKRDRTNICQPLYQQKIDPASYHIITESPQRGDRIYETLKNGDPHTKVDLVILGDGYAGTEQEKFAADMKRFTEIFFALEPYKSHKDRFNIAGIYSPSPESGVDEPRQGSYKKTLLNTTFNSLDSDRYLLTEENKLVRDIAAQVPYDALLIMVNSRRYGGGGFYNVMTLFTSDGPTSDFVFHHEFGHGFGGLADEYYTSETVQEEFFPPGVEPTEPNLTALLDPTHLKWRDLMSPGTSIPTEWGQATFDSLSVARGALAAERRSAVEQLKKGGAPDSVIKRVESEFMGRQEELGRKVTRFMEHHPLRGKIGAFQGGGFVPKGFYRPTVNSIMHQFNATDRTFFSVNEQAIIRVIDYYSR